MKKHLILLTLALVPVVLNAQTPSRQAIRIGSGVYIMHGYDGDWNEDGNSFGLATIMDYQYVLSKYLDLNATFTFSANNYSPKGDRNNYSPSLRIMLTPLPSTFRYIQIGAGLAYSYTKFVTLHVYEETGVYGFLYCRTDSHLFGVDVSFRLYAIDNHKFQLFFDYILNHRFEPQYNWGYWLDNTISINFGVKF